MKLYLPSDGEIHSAAVDLGIVQDGQALTSADRARVARALSDAHAAEQTAQQEAAKAAQERPEERLLSQTTTDVPGGVLVVQVTFHPHKENRAHDQQAQQD